MKKKNISTTTWLKEFGIDLKKMRKAFRRVGFYLADYKTVKKQNEEELNRFPISELCPHLDDRFAESGSASGHYFHQDLYVARNVFARSPEKHVDVGSRIDGFIAHLAAFRRVDVLDIRELANNLPNISFVQCDMMRPLPRDLHDYTSSLSCLHALEHFGLGRYGDPIVLDGYRLGLDNLTKMLRAGGTLYLSVPIGNQRLEFNSHRVFSLIYLMQLLDQAFEIEAFSYVDDAGEMYENVKLDDASVESNFGCRFGCGIFVLQKK